MKALLSVYDKTGLVEFARGLVDLGYEVHSTGGTKRALSEAGVPVASVSDLTGFPEIMGGRVKTLHPGVHAGILANRSEPEHLRQLAEQGLQAIDVVAVNLYPFEETISRPGVGLGEAIENIDIGGPAMVRASAKNHASVVIVVDPTEYPAILEELRQGGPEPARRQALARAAFAHTAAYDAAIAAYLSGLQPQEGWPRDFSLGGHKRQDLRYGENPHQTAALYTSGSGGGVAGAEQLHGIELSYNNIVDVDAAWALVQDLRRPAAAIIKHTNPCGCAEAASIAEAYGRAFECDTTSAFGGIVALNQECDADTARRLAEIFVEVVAAPGYTAEALDILGVKKKVRLLRMAPAPSALVVKVVAGGFLVQSSDNGGFDRTAMRSVGRRPPTDEEWEQLLFAWQVVKHVKSNAIVLAHDLSAVGVGAGQMSRVESVQIAVRRAGPRARGSVMASDALIPFPDGVEAAVAAGVTAIIQPGGSVKDAEVLEPADAAGVAMVHTGKRHFRH
ncbi:MAG TPA: bifunctional phosphoribosylaminoimidazolecarboxamide formyltransferase/IMP cyclohydrolase [Candidatus Dormibacteraeota bacterium]